MRLLLDTHVFLWSVAGDKRLSKQIRDKILHADEVYVSSASIWEATIKIKLQKLEADVEQLVKAISESGFLELSITTEHAAYVAKLPDFHRDPFDRILLAQAICEPLTFFTADNLLKKYSNLVESI